MANMALTSLIASGATVDAAATNVLRTCARRGIKPTREIFNNILGALSKLDSTPLAEVQLWVARMRDAGIRPDTWACNILLKAQLQSGDWSASAALLSGMAGEHAAVNGNAAAAALCADLCGSSYAKMSTETPKGEHAAKLAANLPLKTQTSSPASPLLNSTPGSPAVAPERGMASYVPGSDNDPHRLPPVDAVSFNTAITALGAAHKHQQAESVLARMLECGFCADHTTFTALIAAYARAHRPADAARVLERMVRAKVPPDTIAINTVLLAYAHTANADAARQMLSVFETAAAAGDLPSTTSPDLVSYNTAILACANAAAPDLAETTFGELCARGLSPNQVSFATVLNAHARAGHVAAAQQWLDNMVCHGIVPDAVSYNGVCSAHARVGDAAAALACLQRMESDGVAVTPTTHAIVINAFVKAGDLDAAEKSLAALVASGEPLTAASFNSLISAYAKARRATQAEATLRLMADVRVLPTLVTYNALASAYAATGDLAGVEGVVSRLGAAGLRADRYTYGALLQVCSRCPSAAEGRTRARAHVESLLASSVVLNDYLVSSCHRAVGEAAFAELHERYRGGNKRARERETSEPNTSIGGRNHAPRRPPPPAPASLPPLPPALQRLPPSPALPPPPPAEVPVEAPVEAAPPETDCGSASDDDDEDDGWTAVQRKPSRRKPRHGTHASSTVISPSSIRKTTRAPVREKVTVVVAPTLETDSDMGEPSKSPQPFRLVGIPLRRSKSAMETVLREILLSPPLTGVTLVRSAASELALSLGNEMTLGE